MSAKSIMIMGTGSDVGKSLLVAGLCRAYKNRGIKVAPFKPQNMSNNAAVCKGGGEIGRAQALQARAAGIAPTTAMNPILLKPEHEKGAQVIIRGKRVASMSAREYFATREKYMPEVLSAFEELKSEYDLVIVEGAGSASEVNLRHNDLANFGFAQAANVPVILAGDIERGGVIASIIGTLEVIEKADKELIVASLINKFSGDKALFKQGAKFIEMRTNRLVLGPVPFFNAANKLPAEDVLALKQKLPNQTGHFNIVVPKLSRISNFDDLDPLSAEEGVFVEIIEPGRAIPLDADLIIIPGTKATICDMEFIVEQGWDIDILAFVRAGGVVLGICGGYQILGQEISDVLGIEGEPKTIKGLGLLDVKTSLTAQKQLRVESGKDAVFDKNISGYHMHIGVSEGADCARPFAKINGQNEGAISGNGRVQGTYLHGLFASDDFRGAFLASMGAKVDKALDYEGEVERVLDDFAEHLKTHLDLDAILELAK